MTVYKVSCYSPPSALKIAVGERYEVAGLGTGNKIRADRIKSLAKDGVTCRCGPPIFKALAKTVTGTATNIVYGDGYVEFDLTIQ